MSGNLHSALLIATIGMGLLFGTIILLWGAIALLVRLSTVQGPAEFYEEPESAAMASIADEKEMKKRAAAVAVAVALTSLKSNPALFPGGAERNLSPWQTVMRSRQLRVKQPRG